jgi:hypothetical protein
MCWFPCSRDAAFFPLIVVVLKYGDWKSAMMLTLSLPCKKNGRAIKLGRIGRAMYLFKPGQQKTQAAINGFDWQERDRIAVSRVLRSCAINTDCVPTVPNTCRPSS